MNNEEEVWKDIEGFEGLYQVSSEGRIRSLDREAADRSGRVRILKGKVLKPSMNRDGYLQVMLHKEGKYKCFYVHRLVWIAFCGEILEGYDVNHINEVKTDNRLVNLNLITHKQNCNFGSRNQRVAHALSKPVVAFDDDGNVVLEFSSTRDAARNGFNSGNISACCRCKYKTHHGYRWRYKTEDA